VNQLVEIKEKITSRNKREDTKLVTKVTAAIVDKDRDGRRSFVNSAFITLIIN